MRAMRLIAAVSLAALVVPLAVAGGATTPKAARKVVRKAVPRAAPLSPEDAFFAKNRKLRGVVQTASGLQYKVLTPGAGERPTDSDATTILYVGKLVDGTVFDQSPQPVGLTVSGVVPGFSEALKLMNRGAKYRVWIPSRLGYGARPTGPIPPNSTLVFDIDLIDFAPAY